MSTDSGQSGTPQDSRNTATAAAHLQQRQLTINSDTQPRSNADSSPNSVGRREVPLSAYDELERLYPNPGRNVQGQRSIVPQQQQQHHAQRNSNHVTLPPEVDNLPQTRVTNSTTTTRPEPDSNFWKAYRAQNDATRQKVLDQLRDRIPRGTYEALLGVIREASSSGGQNNSNRVIAAPIQQKDISPPVRQHPNASASSSSIVWPPNQVPHTAQNRPRRFISAASLDDARLLFKKYLPVDFAPGPRFIPSQVKDYSVRYMEDMVTKTKGTVVRALNAAAANSASLMTAIDPRPVEEVIREAASGVGRLVGLLPATDLLDREAHSLLATITAMQASLNESETRALRAEAKMAQMEQEIQNLKQSIPLELEKMNSNQSNQTQLIEMFANLKREVQETSSNQRDMLSHLVKLEERVKSNEEERQREVLERRSNSAVSRESTREGLQEEGIQTDRRPLEVSQQPEEAEFSKDEMIVKEQATSNQSAFQPQERPVERETPTEEVTRTRPTVGMRADSSGKLDQVARIHENVEEERESDEAGTPLVKGEEEEDELVDENQSSLPATRQNVTSDIPPRVDTPKESLNKMVVADPVRPRRSPRKLTSPPNTRSSKKRKRFGLETSFHFHNGKEVESIVIDSSDDDYVSNQSQGDERHFQMCKM